MRCTICNAESEVKLKAITVKHEGKSHTFQAVLAEVCPKCGLVMLDDETSKSLRAAAGFTKP